MRLPRTTRRAHSTVRSTRALLTDAAGLLATNTASAGAVGLLVGSHTSGRPVTSLD